MLKVFFGRVWPYIAGVFSIIAGFIYIRLSGKAEGRRTEKERQQSLDAQGAKAAQENRQNVEALDDNGLAAEFDRLRDKRRR